MNLGELLELPVLRSGRPQVVAGAANLGRALNWVHTGEIADIAQFLSGGEVLLTAATGLHGTEADRRRYVRELAAADAAGVVIELGRAFAKIPPEMIEEAERCGLTLVTLQSEVPFVAVTKTVHATIVNEAHQILARASEIDRDMSQSMLDGAGLSGLLELLAERLGNPVVLEDGSHHVIAFGRASEPVTSLLREWPRHSRTGHAAEATPTGVQLSRSDPDCAWCEVVVRGEVWGRLHLLQVDRPINEVARLALGRGAVNIAMHLLGERSDASLAAAAEQLMIQELASGNGFDADGFRGRADGLGVDLDGSLVIMVVGPEVESTDLRHALDRGGWKAVAATIDEIQVVVAAADPPEGLEAAARRLRSALAIDSTADPIIGVSALTRAPLLPRAYKDARTAHALGASLGSGGVHFYEDLGLYSLLAPLASGPTLANFVEAELGALIVYDEERNADLLGTLDTFIRNNGNKAATAASLHLQRRSVYYRLQRIEEILDCSLDLPVRRLQLHLAIQARLLLA